MSIFNSPRHYGVPAKLQPTEPLWQTIVAAAGLITFFISAFVLYPIIAAAAQ